MKTTYYRAFTLIEILFVIVIISLLLGSVFFFGSQRIATLSTKTHVEEFVQFYNRVHLDSLSSSYVSTGRYDMVSIDFTHDQPVVHVRYMSAGDVIYNEQFSLQGNLLFTMQDDFSIIQKPFALGCIVDPHTIKPQFTIISSQGDRYCFAIVSDSCRLDATLCPSY